MSFTRAVPSFNHSSHFMNMTIEPSKSLGGWQFQLLSNQAHVNAGLSHGGAEREPVSGRPEHIVKRVNCGVATGPLELGDGGLAHPESLGQGDLAETGVITSFADQHGGTRHISIIT
jgi:hypothetical protein